MSISGGGLSTQAIAANEEPTGVAPAPTPRKIHESAGSAGGYAVSGEFWTPPRRRKSLTEVEELVLFGRSLP